MEWGSASTKATTDRDYNSSGFFHSFFIRSFFIGKWCDPRGDRGTGSAHGCLPWHTQWWVVSNEHPCQPYFWRQARLGGFVESPSPSPEASEDEDGDGDFNDDDDDEDEDENASSSDDYTMTAFVTYPLSFVTKRGSNFGMRVVMYIGGELA